MFLRSQEALSLRRRTVIVLTGLAIISSVLWGWLCYWSTFEQVERDALRGVSIVADSREAMFKEAFLKDQVSAANTLRIVDRSCNGQKKCIDSAVASFMSLYHVNAVRLVIRGAKPLEFGKDARKLRELAEMAPLGNRNVELLRTPDGGQNYFIRTSTADGSSTLLASYDIAPILGIFRSSFGLGNSGETFLTDADGFFLTPPRYPHPLGFSHPIDSRPMSLCLSGQSGAVMGLDYRGTAVIHGYRYLKETGGCIMAHIEQAEAFAPMRALRDRIISMVLIVDAIGILIAYWVARGLAKPFEKLTERVRAMDSGDLDSEVPVSGPEELRVLARCLKRMAGSVRETVGRLRGLLESSPDLMVVVDAQGNIEMTNEQVTSWLGYDREDLVGKPVEILIPGRFREAHVRDRTRYMEHATARPMGRGLELFVLHKNGKELPVDISLGPYKTSSGTLVTASVRDISERKEMERKREEAHDQAVAAARARDELLAMVSHDLKNPLSGIMLSADLLSRESVVDEKGKRPLESIRRSSERMLRMIQDLLDLHKIESGRFSISDERGAEDFASIVDEILDCMDALAREKSIQLVCDLPDGLPMVSASRHRIQQVLQNLIGNAIKFTGKGGTVRISAKFTDTLVTCEVSDTGPGIRAALVPHIFDRFFQARETAALGSGLGLSIAKGIVEAHGGRIWVESQEGIGTKFYFTVPLAKPTEILPRKAG